MGWNYRVIKKKDRYCIHEVYYNENDKITAYSENPIEPCGESLEELKKDLELMLEALNKPIIDEKELNSIKK